MLNDLQSWCLIPGVLAVFNKKCKYKLGFKRFYILQEQKGNICQHAQCAYLHKRLPIQHIYYMF